MADEQIPLFEEKWALFDHEGNYRGGVCTRGELPSSIGANPEGYQEVKVERFPDAHEHYNHDTGEWVGDEKKRKKNELKAVLRSANQEEFRELVLREVQEIVFEAFKALFPEREFTGDQIAELFPLLGDK